MPAQDLIVDLAIRYGFQVLGAIVILFVGLVAAWWVGNTVERPLTRLPYDSVFPRGQRTERLRLSRRDR